MRTHPARPAGDAVRARECSTAARPAHTSRTVRRNRRTTRRPGHFEQLGTPLWADRARAELAGAGRRARRPAQDGLTPAEQRVAELAASGLTNRDVAATLFISSKTVEANLARIYRKLGIRSRAEL